MSSSRGASPAVAQVPRARTAVAAAARREDPSWQRYFTPAAIPITFGVGEVAGSRRLFEQAAVYNTVPREHWAFALRRCLKPEQQAALITTRKDPASGIERVQACGDMNYEEIWETIVKRYDNPTSRADAMTEVTDLVWRPDQTPRQFGDALLHAAQRAGPEGAAIDTSLLKTQFYARMAQPLRSKFRENGSINDDWSTMVDRSSDYYNALRPDELATFKANLKLAADLAGAQLAGITGGTSTSTSTSTGASGNTRAAAINPAAPKAAQKLDKPKSDECWGCHRHFPGEGKLHDHQIQCVAWYDQRIDKLKRDKRPHNLLENKRNELRDQKRAKPSEYTSTSRVLSSICQNASATPRLPEHLASSSQDTSEVPDASLAPKADALVACTLDKKIGICMLALVLYVQSEPAACMLDACAHLAALDPSDSPACANPVAQGVTLDPAAASRSGTATPVTHPGAPSPATSSTPRPQTEEVPYTGFVPASVRRLRVAELCCGIGGAHRGVREFARVASINVQVVLAVDSCKATCEQYARLFPDTEVLCADIASIRVRERLLELHPDVIWNTSSCVEFSPAGKGIEGEAARALVHVARLAVDCLPALVFNENVPRMLQSNSWGDFCRIMGTKGYSTYEVQFRGTDVNGASSRERVYTVTAPNTSRLPERFARLNAILNERFRTSTPRTVREHLGCAHDTFYWDPRQPFTPGVLSTDMPLPSPVTRQPGRGPPASYQPRDKDAGPVNTALVLSCDQVMSLLGYSEPHPEGTKTQKKRWAANLVQPNCVTALMLALHAVAALPTEWPSSRNLDVELSPGEVVMHDHTAPPPEWLVESNPAQPVVLRLASACVKTVCQSLHNAGRTLLDALTSKSDSCVSQTSWMHGEDEEDFPASDSCQMPDIGIAGTPLDLELDLDSDSDVEQPSSNAQQPSLNAVDTDAFKAMPRWSARHKNAKILQRARIVGKPKRNGFVRMPVRTACGVRTS